MKTKLILIGGMIALLFCSTPVYAALDLALGSVNDVNGSPVSTASLLDVSLNLIDAYYTSAPSDPRDTTNRLLLAPDITTYNSNAPVNASDWEITTLYKGYISGGQYFFTRHTDENSPGEIVAVRVWSSSPNQLGGYYAKATSGRQFNNGTTSTINDTLDANTTYKADVPYKPVINQFEEITTTDPINQTQSASLKVYSAQSATTDGAREVTSYSWRWGDDPGNMTDPGVNDNELSISSNQLNVGTTYYFEVTYTNWFGSQTSDIQDYTVSGGAGAGVASTTLNLKANINNFSLPSGPSWYAYQSDGSTQIDVGDGSNEIANAYELVKAINGAAGADVVSTFGYYDETNQQVAGVMIPSPYDQAALDTVKTLLEAITPLSEGRGYQVYISQDVDLVIKNQ